MRKTTVTLLLAASILSGTATAATAGVKLTWRDSAPITEAGSAWKRVATVQEAGHDWTAPELGRKLT